MALNPLHRFGFYTCSTKWEPEPQTRVVAHHALLGHRGVKKIRWKECANELLPCECLLFHSSLASRLSVSGSRKGGGAGGLCWDTATSATDTCRGRTGSSLPLLLLLALKFHLSSKQHLLPSNVHISWHVPSWQCFGADIHQRRELLSW